MGISQERSEPYSRIHEKCLRVVYRGTTSVFERLQIKDFFVSMHYRIIQALATAILSLQGDISTNYEIGLPTKPTFEL